MIIGIIGAGASGMAAALAAAENPNVQVKLFERHNRVGRKLLATGNGRCNLSNIHAGTCGYHGQEADFSRTALTKFHPEETLAWFQNLGLFTVVEDNGRVYPYSDQANSVVDVLRLALDKPNISVLTGFDVQKITKAGTQFKVDCVDEQVLCDKIILACGGLAGTKLGGSMSGYKLLSKFGHKSTRLRPALVQLKTDWVGVVALKGVRSNCRVRILRDKAIFSESAGEVQFTEYGLSGPVIFEVSRDVCYGSGQWCAVLDFLPDYKEEQLINELYRRRNAHMPMDELLTGVLHNRLGRVITKCSGIQNKRHTSELSDYEIQDICKAIKAFTISLTEPMGMDCAQVTAGGVLTTDFDSNTMESRLVPGLYACGEVLDIDGDCGGYNLQWAWSSGRLAGTSAGKEAL